MSERVLIFDTTLRDGEQAGHPMLGTAKLELAKMSAQCGVDIIEVGFPASSAGEWEIVQSIAEQVRGITVCALARANEDDITKAWESISVAEKPRIHTFVPTSDVHIEKKLGKTRPEVLAMAIRSVEYACSLCRDVQFSAEDATRSVPEYLAEVITAAIKAGATTINLPDTVGYAQPDQYRKMLDYLFSAVDLLKTVKVSTHCHDDLGLAVANSLAGVVAGARQVEGCWLGIGERAGNAALEEVVMALTTHPRYYGVKTGILTELIGPMCRQLSRTIGYPVPTHQPVVGEQAFTHCAGIHAHGMKKDRNTYEIMKPESVGWEGPATQLSGRLGKHGLSGYLSKLGYRGQEIVAEVYPQYEALADLKGVLTDEDLHMIVQELRIRQEISQEKLFDFVDNKPGDYDYGPTTGAVKIRRNGKTISTWASGDGSIDALHNAIREAITAHGVNLDGLKLKEFRVEKGHGSSEAIGWVFIQVSQGDRIGFGRSGNPSVDVAAAKAYVYAINHLMNCPPPKPPDMRP